jgi:hypothetical protein
VTASAKSHAVPHAADILAVVVLAALALSAYWFVGRDASPALTATTPPSLAIGGIPGTPTGKHVQRFEDVVAFRYLTSLEVKAYRAARPTEAAVLVNSIGQPRGDVIVLTVQTGGIRLARTAVAGLAAQQLTYHAVRVAGQPKGVQVTRAGSTVRGHYYTDQSVIVRVEVSGPDAARALKEFDAVLSIQLKTLPADDR